MGFLSPLLLALGAAAAVPIILHLFQRHQGPRVVFPALRYLRRAEKENARQIKLRQLLLMLLRVAAVVLLALAAARPFAHGAGSQHQPTAVAIVLDNSLSSGMVAGDRRVLDELKDRALETLDAAGPDDRFWLIRAGAPWEPAYAGDPLATAARVRETLPTASAADIGAALTHARVLLAAGTEGRATEIHLLGDQQQSNLGELPAGRSGDPAIVAWVPSGEPPPNRAVASVDVGGGFTPIAGERSTVAVSLAGTGAGDSAGVRLALDGRIVAAGAAAAAATAVLPFPARPAGLVEGWVEIDADALRADDRRYFSLRIREPPAVAVTAAVPFVDEALSVMQDARRLRIATVATADVVIAPGAAGLEAVPVRATAVVLPPDAELELPAANRRLGAAGLAWRYDGATSGGEARFALAEEADDVLRTLERVRLTRVFPLRTQQQAPTDTVLLGLADGSPWAVRGERRDGGRYILLASPLSADATTLPTSAAMVPLLDRIIGVWASERPVDGAVRPGAELALPDGTTSVRRPDGVVEPVTGVVYLAGGEPGIYRALADDTTLAMFAVNPPVHESQLDRLDARSLRDALNGWTVETANSPREWAGDIYRERLGREIGRPLLLLLLAVLVVEAFVAAAGRLAARRGPPTGRRGVAATEPETAEAGLAGARGEAG